MVDEPGSELPRALDEAIERLLIGSLRAPRLEAGARRRILARVDEAAPRRRRRWRPWLLVPALAAGLAGAGMVWLAARSGPAAGVVISAEPGLERLRQGRAEAATAATVLHTGDLLRTARGRAVVRLEGRSLVSLEPHTSLEVGTGPVAAALTSGRARFQVAPASERFRVRTAAGTVEVTGTTFEIAVLGDGPSVRVLVHLLEGSLRAEGARGFLALGTGESAVLAPEAPPRRIQGVRPVEDAETVARAATLVDCTRAGDADCEAIAEAVKSLQAMEDPISSTELQALAQATWRAQAQHLAALRRLYTEAVGGEPVDTASYEALVEEIEGALPAEELREAHSRVADGSTSTLAGRFVALVGDMNEAIRTELSRLVPLHRVAPILSSRARRSEGGRP